MWCTDECSGKVLGLSGGCTAPEIQAGPPVTATGWGERSCWFCAMWVHCVLNPGEVWVNSVAAHSGASLWSWGKSPSSHTPILWCLHQQGALKATNLLSRGKWGFSWQLPDPAHHISVTYSAACLSLSGHPSLGGFPSWLILFFPGCHCAWSRSGCCHRLASPCSGDANNRWCKKLLSSVCPSRGTDASQASP